MWLIVGKISCQVTKSKNECFFGCRISSYRWQENRGNFAWNSTQNCTAPGTSRPNVCLQIPRTVFKRSQIPIRTRFRGRKFDWELQKPAVISTSDYEIDFGQSFHCDFRLNKNGVLFPSFTTCGRSRERFEPHNYRIVCPRTDWKRSHRDPFSKVKKWNVS